MKTPIIVSCLLTFWLIFGLSAHAIDLTQGILFDVPDGVAEAQFGKMPLSQLSPQDSAAIAAYRFDADTFKVLAILIDWSDRPATYPKEIFDSLYALRDVSPGGSVADYFYEVSYGQLNMAIEVRDWYDAGSYSNSFDFETVFPNLDPYIDYSQYDGDNDGNVDAVIFIRSGNGEEDSGDPNDIWSYAYSYNPGYGPGPYDGVRIPRWCTAPETMPVRDSLNPHNFSGVDILNSISVAAHELAHNVGSPDLYDYDAKLDTATFSTPNDDNDHPFVDWCLMGYNGYGLMSIKKYIPPHLCGWNKQLLGWINPVVLEASSPNEVVIYDIETHEDSSLYMLPITPWRGEYFLLEYRNPHSTAKFDKLDSDFSVYLWPDLTYGSDSLDRGLLITHVDESVGASFWRINAGTPNYDHYTVAVEDAGYNPSQDAYSNPEGFVTDSAQWWYPFETRKAAPFSNDVAGQEEFNPGTYPSSDGYYGTSGVYVRVDSIVGDKLYAYIDNPVEVGDTDEDGLIDMFDNCPLIFNPGQEDFNGDGIGDACECDLVLQPFTGQAGENLGRSVSGAGDVNNDGFDDVIIGAMENDVGGAYAGQAYVYSGASGAKIYTFTGEASGDYLGYSVSGAGDVNNDGYDDVIVGAHYNDEVANNAGKVYVFSGIDGDTLHTFTGEASGDYFGRSVSGAGDVDGDGFDDLIVGADFNDAAGYQAGRAYVFSGQTGGLLYTFSGEASYRNWFGGSVSDAGDVNNDGFGDVIVGASGNDAAATDAGRVYVFSGNDGDTLHVFTGAVASDYFGSSVSGAGDVDNDGFDDLIVGASGANSAYVYSGKTGDLINITTSGPVFDGYSVVSGAGDVNSDGFDDYIVGAWASDIGGVNRGRAYLYSGNTGGLINVFTGWQDNGRLGISVSGAGDFNNDGSDEVIVGAYYNNTGGTRAGQAYVYSVTDKDADGLLDACDYCTDTDGDGYGDPGFWSNYCLPDNCPTISNPDQIDTNEDGVGDACEFVCGDADGSGVINILDVTRLISYLYKEGPAPDPLEAGDADGSGVINILDVTRLINYLYKEGPAPVCP